MIIRGTGALLDDGSYAGVTLPLQVGASSFPTRHEGVTRWLPGVSDQGSDQSCVAHAMAAAIHAAVRRETGEQKHPSQLALWYFARAVRGAEAKNVGCSPEDMFRAIETHGWPEKSDWYEPSSWDVSPDQECMARAADAIPVHGASLNAHRMTESIKSALCAEIPVLLTIASDDGYVANQGTWVRSGSFRGYHEVLAVRYSEAGVVTQGSYGRGHGAYGMTTIPWSLVEDDSVLQPWALILGVK